jgi:hypothetical protein
MTDDEIKSIATLIAEHIKPTREVMDTEQAAEYLGVSRQFLEISRCKGGGPAFVKWARLCRYRKAALDEWLLSHQQMNTVENT